MIDLFWKAISTFGNIKYLTLYIMLFSLVFLKKDRKTFKWIYFILIPSIYLSSLTTFFLKDVFRIPRPCVGLPGCPSDFSFPSGHATAVFSLLASIMIYKRDRKVTAFFLLLALLVSYSRIALHVHRVSDILGGFAVGFIIPFIYKFFYDKIKKLRGYTLRKLIHLSGFFVLVVYHFFGPIKTSLLLLLVSVIFFFSEIFRKRKFYIPLLHDMTLKCIKKEEKRFALSPLFYSLALSFLSVMPFREFYIGLVSLTIGDSVSGIVGNILFKKKEKSIYGSTVFFISVLIFLLPFIGIVDSIVFSVISAVIEFLTRDEAENLLIALVPALLAFIF